jgi:micrococcal nuclease
MPPPIFSEAFANRVPRRRGLWRSFELLHLSRHRRWVLAFGVWGCSAVVFAQAVAHPAEMPPWTGWVSWVADGDTLLVLPNQAHEAVKLRIANIDAPERCQSGGEDARNAMIDWVHRKTVQVTPQGTDTYGRVLARVEMDGRDVGAEMVASGMAWAYSFRTGAGPYAALERQARRQKKGVFAQAQPMTPKVFRQFHGSCQTP